MQVHVHVCTIRCTSGCVSPGLSVGVACGTNACQGTLKGGEYPVTCEGSYH